MIKQLQLFKRPLLIFGNALENQEKQALTDQNCPIQTLRKVKTQSETPNIK